MIALEAEGLEWTYLQGRLGPGRNTSSSRRRKYWGDSLKKGKVISLVCWSNWDPWSATPSWIWPRARLDLRGNWCLERPTWLSHQWRMGVSSLSKDIYVDSVSELYHMPLGTAGFTSNHIGQFISKLMTSYLKSVTICKANSFSCALLIVYFFRLQFCNYYCFLSSHQFLSI